MKIKRSIYKQLADNLNRPDVSINYDTSWDLIESDEGNLPDDEDAYERKYQEWMERDWIPWLRRHLSFPFQVERMEDEDDAYFTDVAEHEPFRLGHIMDVIGIESEEDDRCGVIDELLTSGSIWEVQHHE